MRAGQERTGLPEDPAKKIIPRRAVRALFARLRIDQTVGLWWRYGVLLVLVQWFVTLLGRYLPL